MKKLIQSIYGMQYEELVENGKDGNKARFNGNIFTAAYIFVAILLIIVIFTCFPGYDEAINRFLHRTFGYFASGKGLGKILAIPLMGLLYFMVSKTIGTEAQFKKHVEAYANFSVEEKKKSVGRVLVPFLVMLGLMLVLALSQL